MIRNLSLAAALGLTLAFAAAAQEPEGFKVIVHGATKGGAIRREQLAAVFLRKLTRWGDGTPIVPVDQSSRSLIRSEFSLRVLGKPLSLVQEYWHRQILDRGERSPVVRGSDEEVVAWVASTAGGIGYVALGTEVGNDVKVLKILD